MRNTSAIVALTKLSATAALAAFDTAPITGFADFELTAKNDAGTDPTLDVKLQDSEPAVRGYSMLTAGTTETKLKTGAATLVKLAMTFTQTSAASIQQVGLKLRKIGTIASGKKVTVEICADSTGAPGTALASTTIDIDTAISGAFGTVVATFANPVDVAAEGVYHVVLSADYTASSTNCAVVRSATVASGGTLQSFDGTSTWTAVTTEKVEAFVDQFVFADITGGAFTQATAAAVRQTKTLYAEAIRRYVRPVVTIGGTNSPAFYVGLDVVAQPRN